MTGHRPGIYWQVTWRFLAPIIMVCILVSSVASMFIKKPQYSAWNASLVRKLRDKQCFDIVTSMIFNFEHCVCEQALD